MTINIFHFLKNFFILIVFCIIVYLIIIIDFKENNSKTIKKNDNNIGNNNDIKNTNNIYYCGSYNLNKPLDNSIKHYNLNKVNTLNNIKIYMPCGFNYLEVELNKIRFAPNKDKYDLKNIVILGISLCDKLCSKNELWNTINKYYGIDISSNITPRSYLINDTNDIYLLKDNNIMNNNTIMSNNYDNNKSIYILKNNKQGKKGLYLTNNINSIITDNEKLKTYKIIQEYITNPYLINKRKVNIRMYVIIINKFSNNPEWYLYKEGKCIYTNKDYTFTSLNNINILDNEQHFTSLNLDTDYVYNILNNPESLNDLKQHLGILNYNLLIQKIQYKLNLIKTSYNSENILNNKGKLKNNICMQYFGIDVILDNDLEPYILEFNKGPEMNYKTENDKVLKTTFMLEFIKIALIEYNKVNPRKQINIMDNKNIKNSFYKNFIKI